jgi:hypothetical protein
MRQMSAFSGATAMHTYKSRPAARHIESEASGWPGGRSVMQMNHPGVELDMREPLRSLP